MYNIRGCCNVFYNGWFQGTVIFVFDDDAKFKNGGIVCMGECLQINSDYKRMLAQNTLQWILM